MLARGRQLVLELHRTGLLTRFGDAIRLARRFPFWLESLPRRFEEDEQMTARAGGQRNHLEIHGVPPPVGTDGDCVLSQGSLGFSRALDGVSERIQEAFTRHLQQVEAR